MISILIVDDDKSTAQLWKAALSSTDRAIQTIGNGNDAMGLLFETNYDLLITDIFHEGISGLEMIGLIKSNSEFRNMRILVVSGHAHGQLAEEAWNRGADGVLSKPVEIHDLRELVRTILAKEPN